MQTIDNITNDIPDGWRFYMCDASIPGRFSITLCRNEDGKKWWLSLTDEDHEIVSLFCCGTGKTFGDAFRDAISKPLDMEDFDEFVKKAIEDEGK